MNKKLFLIIVLLLAMGWYLRLDNILTKDGWFDESFSILHTKQSSFSDLFMANDVHPMGYYLALKLWSSYFGYTILAQRLFSVLIGMAVLYSILFITTKLFDFKTGIITLAISSLSLSYVVYSNEIRMYMLSVLVILWCYYLFEKKKYLYFSLLFALSIYIHYYNGIFILYPIYKYITQKGSQRTSIIQSLYLFATLCIPIGIYFLLQVSRIEGMWLKYPSILALPSAFYHQFLIPSGNVMANINSLTPFVFLLCIAGLILATRYKGREREKGLLFIFFVPAIVMLLLAYLVKIPYHPRFLLPFAFSGYILVSIGVQSVWSKDKFTCVVICLFIAVMGAMAYHEYYGGVQTELKQISQYFNENGLCPANIVHESPFSMLPLEVYLPNCNHYLKTNLTTKQGHSAGFDVLYPKQINNPNITYQYYIQSEHNYFNGTDILVLDGVKVIEVE